MYELYHVLASFLECFFCFISTLVINTRLQSHDKIFEWSIITLLVTYEFINDPMVLHTYLLNNLQPPYQFIFMKIVIYFHLF
jgi:hypothetical protein